MRNSMRIRLSMMIAGLGLSYLNGPPLRADGPPKSDADPMAAEIHEGFADLGEGIGGLTEDEKTKLAAVEKNIVADAKAHPKKAKKPEFKEEILKEFRTSLNPEHQLKFDGMMASMYQSKTSLTLHEVGVLELLYSNDNAGKIPPDLGAIATVEKATPGEFLTANSKTTPPADWATMDAKTKAAWVNKNTDFIYLAGGKTGNLDSNFVVAYVKPELAPAGNSFLMGDGRVETKNVDESKAIVADLTAKKNPPPSLKESTPQMPPDMKK